MEDIVFESLFIKSGEHETLHMKRIHCGGKGVPVFMIHGSLENGKIFYTDSGKGFASFLARNGYDVFVADLRGRGLSTPPINKQSKHGLTEILWEDFPLYLSTIKELKGNIPQYWVSHSWGGCLFLAYLARKINESNVKGLVFFGTKRYISVRTLKKFYMIDLSWNLISKLLIALYGYLPAKRFNFGADNETQKSHRETNEWVCNKKWVDWNDGLDYSQTLKNITLPPILTITGANDDVLGHPKDVKHLMIESGITDFDFRVIGLHNGNKHNYDHINILTHKDALEDHFMQVLEWMAFKQNSVNRNIG